MVSATGAWQEPDPTTGCYAMDALKSANLAVRSLLELYATGRGGVLGCADPIAPAHEGRPRGWRAQPLPWGVVVDDQHDPGRRLMVAGAEQAWHLGYP